ncbi:HEAT repeat domain-containing protein [Nostoc sp. UIC 10607]|uniref:HEAT repeat domain-containing protein n=1 Tax=Nostoc sp. UIC 10607 TaxID=3045935 RepID=UPI00399F3A86
MCNIKPCPQFTVLSIKPVLPENEILSSCIEAIGKIGSCKHLPLLLKSLKHSDSDVRSSAAIALGQIRCDNETVILALIEALKDSEYYVRVSAVKAIGELGDEKAIPQLINILQDNDSYVRDSAAKSLEKISSKTVFNALSEKLKNRDFILANEAKTFTQTIKALEAVQQSLKYYKPTPIRTMSNTISHNYALLIGVGECAYPEWSLPVTVKDIQALKTLLIDPNLCCYIDNNQHMRLLHDNKATRQHILDGLNWLKQQAENDPEATIFIYYSGHGWLDNSSGKYYLIPHDTKPHKLTKTALPAETFNAALQQIPAKKLLVIIDSCHAQEMASSKDEPEDSELPDNFVETALPKNLIDELKQGTGRVVFTSSTGQQKSWVRPDKKMSVYTYHLLEALQGAANQPGDKVVRISHLMSYLSETVPASAKAKQTPFFDLAAEDFPVALLRGGKGLPPKGWQQVKSEAQDKIDSIIVKGNSSVNNRGNNNIILSNVGTANISSNQGK